MIVVKCVMYCTIAATSHSMPSHYIARASDEKGLFYTRKALAADQASA